VYVALPVRLRVLTWNLMHGRSLPSAGRYLLDDFAGALSGWEWDLALLQEVPPWWPAQLAARVGGDADARLVLTSRNFGLALRRAVAVRWPDLIKSNGGGANAILVRGIAIEEHRTARLCLWPERRQLQAVRLASGAWAGNLHATVHDDAAARRDAERARATILEWAGGSPVMLVGDFNVRELSLEGLTYAGGHDVDLVFARGLEPIGEVEVLERGTLSDHAPVRVTLGR
jgi:endonuclease/exonuclease/phosphatase family metal-dependent hydrolase